MKLETVFSRLAGCCGRQKPSQLSTVPVDAGLHRQASHMQKARAEMHTHFRTPLSHFLLSCQSALHGSIYIGIMISSFARLRSKAHSQVFAGISLTSLAEFPSVARIKPSSKHHRTRICRSSNAFTWCQEQTPEGPAHGLGRDQATQRPRLRTLRVRSC